MASNQPNLVSGLKNNYPQNMGFQVPQQPQISPQIPQMAPQVSTIPVPQQPQVSQVVPPQEPQVDGLTNLMSGEAVEIFGQQIPKTYIYLLGLIIVGIVLYFLYNWYYKGKKSEDDEDEDEEYDIPTNMIPMMPGGFPNGQMPNMGQPGMAPQPGMMAPQPGMMAPQPGMVPQSGMPLPNQQSGLEGRGPRPSPQPSRNDKVEQIPIHHSKGSVGQTDGLDEAIQDL